MEIGKSMRRVTLAWLSILGLLTNSVGGASAETSLGYRAELDVVYGQAIIAPDGVEVERDLRMDVYYPDEENADFSSAVYQPSTARPAVIYIHGGAHHRGGRR